MRSVAVLTILFLTGICAAQDATYGDFYVDYGVDAMTDDPAHVMFTFAIEAPSRQSNARFAIQCDPEERHGVDVWVWADEYLASDAVTVDYRFDDEPAVLGTDWNASNNGTAAYMRWDMQLDLIPAFAAHALFRVRVYDYNSVAYDFLFSLEGFNDALAAIGCWRPNRSD